MTVFRQQKSKFNKAVKILNISRRKEITVLCIVLIYPMLLTV